MNVLRKIIFAVALVTVAAKIALVLGLFRVSRWADVALIIVMVLALVSHVVLTRLAEMPRFDAARVGEVERTRKLERLTLGYGPPPSRVGATWPLADVWLYAGGIVVHRRPWPPCALRKEEIRSVRVMKETIEVRHTSNEIESPLVLSNAYGIHEKLTALVA